MTGFDWLVRVERSRVEVVLWPPKLDPDATLGDAVRGSGMPSVPAADLDWHAAYDALGRRLWTRSGATRREFYWDGDRLAAEVFPSRAFRVYHYASPEALAPLGFTDYSSVEAAPETGKTYHVFSSPVGVPLRIEDERGTAVWRARRVDPYGSLDIASDTGLEYKLRWPGHYFDPETGLHYNRYRYYDPKLGGYLQSDPIGYEGSPVNLYAYCPNPLARVDVLGWRIQERRMGPKAQPRRVASLMARKGLAASFTPPRALSDTRGTGRHRPQVPESKLEIWPSILRR